MFERSVQLVACEFLVTTDTQAIADRLDDGRPSAVQEYPVLCRHRLEVRSASAGFLVRENNGEPTLVQSAEEAVALVDRRMHELAVAALADRTKLHAGCGVWFGRRFLVVGRGGAGKTTLMTRLLTEDCSVEGDELVVLRDGEAVAYPRLFGVRRLTLSLVPSVGALVPHLATGPGSDEPGGYHVLALDPNRLRVPWRIGYGRVDVVFLLGSRHAGTTRLTLGETPAILRRLMEQSAPPDGAPGGWVRDLSALASGAAVYDLEVGDLDSAISLMRQSVRMSARIS